MREKIGSFTYKQELYGGVPLSETQSYYRLKGLAEEMGFYKIHLAGQEEKPYNLGQLLFGANGYRGSLNTQPKGEFKEGVVEVDVFVNDIYIKDKHLKDKAIQGAKILLERIKECKEE